MHFISGSSLKNKINPIENNQEIKEKFYSVKKTHRRMKSSVCLSQHQKEDCSKIANSFKSIQTSASNSKTDNQDLISTFGSANILVFKPKPPRRKKNKNPFLKNQDNFKEKEAAQSDCEIPTSIRLKQQRKLFIQASIKKEQKNQRKISLEGFLFLEKIGVGTYSEVYKVIEKETGMIFALKILQKDAMRKMKVQQNVIREMKIQLFLNHPHITKLYGCFHDETHIYMITEFSTGKNLYDNLMLKSKETENEKKGFPVEIVSSIMSEICQALNHIHRNLIIHRDIKPENIMLTMDQTIKICDFGWSIYNPQRLLRSTLCGTPLYLAPQLISQTEYTESVDVWAIGVLAFQLLTEEIPFKIRSISDLKKVLVEEIKYEKVSSLEAIDFIRNALEKDAEKRKNIEQLCHHPFLFLGKPDPEIK